MLSQSFIAKGWTNYELDGIVTKAVTGEQVLLPGVAQADQARGRRVQSLSGRPRNTATHTVVEIAQEIAGVAKAKLTAWAMAAALTYALFTTDKGRYHS